MEWCSHTQLCLFPYELKTAHSKMHSHKGSTTRAAVGHLMEEIGVLCASPATRPAASGFQQRGKHHEEHCICGCR